MNTAKKQENDIRLTITKMVGEVNDAIKNYIYKNTGKSVEEIRKMRTDDILCSLEEKRKGQITIDMVYFINQQYVSIILNQNDLINKEWLENLEKVCRRLKVDFKDYASGPFTGDFFKRHKSKINKRTSDE